MEVRRLKPPKLSSPSNFGPHLLCYRPMRVGGPRVCVEERNSRHLHIVHNYGHGGSGLTLAPGSTHHAVCELFLEHSRTRSKHSGSETTLGGNNSPSSSITVVGAGVIGLFTAYWLLKIPEFRGRVRIVAEHFSQLTTHLAAGVFAPVSMTNSPEGEALVDKFFTTSYKFYRQVAEGRHEDFKQGATIISAYFPHRDTSKMERFAEAGVMAKSKDVLVDFANGCRREMVVYDDALMISAVSPTSRGIVDMLTEWLRASDRVDFVQRRLTSFDELLESTAEAAHAAAPQYIFNCAGLGACQLAGDESLIPVLGHMIELREQGLEYPCDADGASNSAGDIPYAMVGPTKDEERGTMRIISAEGKEYTIAPSTQVYLFPKYFAGCGERGMLGGSFIPTPHQKDTEGAMWGKERVEGEGGRFESLVKEAKIFFGVV